MSRESARENARRAMQEMFGSYAAKPAQKAAPAPEPVAEPEPEPVPIAEEPVVEVVPDPAAEPDLRFETEFAPDFPTYQEPAAEEPTAEPEPAAVVEEPVAEPEPAPVPAPSAPENVTTIGGSTVITGSIQSPDTLNIHGLIQGDIQCDGDVFLYGRVAGNITCRRFVQYSGAVKGDITTEGDITIEREGAVRGNLHCASIHSDGRIIGNVIARENVELAAEAVIVGDVSAAFFSMQSTTRLQGLVQLNNGGAAPAPEDPALDELFDF